jgi:hypothetical protein
MTIRQFHGIRHSNSYTSFLSTPDMRVQIWRLTKLSFQRSLRFQMICTMKRKPIRKVAHKKCVVIRLFDTIVLPPVHSFIPNYKTFFLDSELLLLIYT